MDRASGRRRQSCSRTKALESSFADERRKSSKRPFEIPVVPPEIVALQADIADPESVRGLFDEVEDRFGRLDVLFAHAGINGVWAPIEELTAEEWSRTIDINLTGTFHTVKYAVPLLKRRGGSVIITSSINGTMKFSDIGSSAYCASKSGQIGFMRLMALELADQGIRVDLVSRARRNRRVLA